jgi:hypothetical protein
MRRSRGVFLLHYGDHLSEPLKELARKASERPLLDKETPVVRWAVGQ